MHLRHLLELKSFLWSVQLWQVYTESRRCCLISPLMTSCVPPLHVGAWRTHCNTCLTAKSTSNGQKVCAVRSGWIISSRVLPMCDNSLIHLFNCRHWDLYKIYDLRYLQSSRTATLGYWRCLFTHHIFVWFSSAQTTAQWLILVKMLPPLHFAHKIFKSKHRTILVDGSLES